MTRPPTNVEQSLADANPVQHSSLPIHSLDARAQADLTAILDGTASTRLTAGGMAERPPGRAYVRPVVLAAALVAVAGVFVSGVVDLPGAGLQAADGAYAATPAQLSYQPMARDAAAVLNDIASRTALLPDDTRTGRYAMVSTQGWYLSTEIDGQTVTSVVVPQDMTTWKAEDGSGRVVTEYTLPDEDKDVEEQYAEPGELAIMWPPRSLSVDDATLTEQLEGAHPVENGSYERLIAISDAYRDMPIEPQVRAAMLRYLSATPGLQLDGLVKDRLGRLGIAVSVVGSGTGLPTRYTLIIDSETGRLLGQEQTLTTDAGKLNVPTPSVISYTAYRDSYYSDQLE